MWLDVGCWFTVPERTAVQIPAHHARRTLARGGSSGETAMRGSDLEDRHTAKGSSRYYGAAPWADCSGRVQSTTRVSEGTHIGTEGRDTASTQCQGQGSRAGPSCSSGRRAESWPTAGKPVCLSPSADVQPEPATSFRAGRRTSLVVFVVPGPRGWHEAPASSEVACGSPVQVVFVVPAVMGSPFPRLGRHHSE